MMWVSAIFDGFTFTDWYDFVPLGCLVGGLVAAGLSGLRAPRPASLWLKGILSVLALWPLYPLAPLVMLALQVVKVRGNWPQVMVDDPKNLVGLSPSYDFWFHVTDYAEAIAGAALVTFLFFLGANRDRLTPRFKWQVLSVCGVAILVSIADPGHLFAWWID